MDNYEINNLAIDNNLTYEDMRRVMIIQTKIVNLMKLKENNKLKDVEVVNNYLDSLSDELDELINKSNNSILNK